jgi:hypothetical protein
LGIAWIVIVSPSVPTRLPYQSTKNKTLKNSYLIDVALAITI